MVPRDGEGRPRQETPRRRLDQSTVARERIRTTDRRRRIAAMADEVMPMGVWYRQPKGAFYCTVVEGWRAA